MSSRTNEQILATLKKANKAAKLRMAQKAKFTTADDYRKFLEREIAGGGGQKLVSNRTLPRKGKPTVHIVNILDKSSSMGWGGSNNRMTAALKGLNTELIELKDDNDVNYIYSLVTFSDSNKISTLVNRTHLSQVGSIHAEAYGNTALYDAIGVTLSHLKTSTTEGEKVLVKIFTDGKENDSKKYNAGQIERLIEEVKTLGFTVTFVGTDKDVKEVVRRLSIDDSNTLVHDNTSRGITMSFNASVNAVKGYAQKVLNNEDVTTGFYKSNEKL